MGRYVKLCWPVAGPLHLVGTSQRRRGGRDGQQHVEHEYSNADLQAGSLCKAREGVPCYRPTEMDARRSVDETEKAE